MSHSIVRVRFAPSPTGYLHVGGLRTALYNYLFARRNNGVFLLRIEDTDRSRYVEGAVENLIETLRWAGLDYDEGPGKGGPCGPYVQSERLSTYREYALRLVEAGKAYYAFETAEELRQMRSQAERAGSLPGPQRDRPSLRLTPDEVRSKLEAGEPAVIRLKVPDGETVAFDDVVRGRVEFSSDMLDDQVLLKSDGYPTYHLANVVDDHLMQVSHIIRGEEWLSSTPKHVLLYRYLGWDPPVFAHLPLLLNPDRSKLSKRQGDVAVEDYRQKGVLPEALVNFVALLGWNPGDERELFTLEELAREFSLERVGKSGAVFNLEKLAWMNTQYLRRSSDERLESLVRPHLLAAGLGDPPPDYVRSVIRLMRDRMNHPEDIAKASPYFFRDPDTYEEKARQKNWKPETPSHLRAVADGIAHTTPFAVAGIEGLVRSTAERFGAGAGKIIHPLRLAITGVSAGPGLFEIMELIGPDACLRRIERALERLQH